MTCSAAPRKQSLKCAAAVRSVEVKGNMASCGRYPSGIAVESSGTDLDRMRLQFEVDVDVHRRHGDAAAAAQEERRRLFDRQRQREPLADPQHESSEPLLEGLIV